MSQFVDEALREAPASCNSPTTSIAALASASNTAGSVNCADVQPSAGNCEAGAEVLSQRMPEQASNKLQERDEQGSKRCSDRLGSSGSVRSIGSKKVNKPAWAMTADAALGAEQQEEEDLLAFAGGLEFDKYIDQQEDAELRTVLQVSSEVPLGQIVWLVTARTACQRKMVCLGCRMASIRCKICVYKLLTAQASCYDRWCRACS